MSLHYSYIKPTALPLNKFLFRIPDGEFRRQYLKDPAGVLASYDLTEEQRQAVLTQDTQRLVALGAHPMLALLLKIFTDMDQRPNQYEFY